MNHVLAENPSWAAVLAPDTARVPATLTIEDLDTVPDDAAALFTLCVLAPEPAETVAA
ncbi:MULTISPECIES: hypothetical protein [Streptomyces]|uniref:Gra-orf13 protein n=2 Tax=Streptomyces TaxID=1883 RepID=Q9ZA44_STRVN|nr:MULTISPECIES: hypothetical protein [Streptomyces]QGZ49880.1 hypothetical protein GPZ77_17220 [Streptomyces sp. QHH-9511]QJD07469.1 hypothetical protein [Streptomyces sp.]GGT68302.1 hypothetical protein GCM10010272_09000 [Streptomyces lateritius]CAA09634.1 gra-orf13 [Streptomyces violaceoruber]